jgi:type IX secretion system PorP/SprF family membrane protein
MKKLILVFGVLLSVQAGAQQIVMNSLYMLNDFPINPAVAGTKNYAPITIALRRQWMGIREAPAAQHISYHGHFHKQIGGGAYVFNDAAGPTRRTGFMAALSTQVAPTRNTRLSFGLGLSLSQFVLNREKLFTEEAGDVTVDQYGTNMLVPDVAAGIHWYSNLFHIGVSAHNLIRSKTDLTELITPVTSTLDRAIYVNGSYLIERNRRSKFSVEPSAMLRVMFNAPLTFDANVRFIYDHWLWFGGSYRFFDSGVLMAGFEKGFFGLGYAYDLGLSGLRSFHSGSHEVVLIFRTNKGANDRLEYNNRNRVYDCPAFR